MQRAEPGCRRLSERRFASLHARSLPQCQASCSLTITITAPAVRPTHCQTANTAVPVTITAHASPAAAAAAAVACGPLPARTEGVEPRSSSDAAVAAPREAVRVPMLMPSPIPPPPPRAAHSTGLRHLPAPRHRNTSSTRATRCSTVPSTSQYGMRSSASSAMMRLVVMRRMRSCGRAADGVELLRRHERVGVAWGSPRGGPVCHRRASHHRKGRSRRIGGHSRAPWPVGPEVRRRARGSRGSTVRW